MPKTEMLFDQEQDSMIWEGLEKLSHLPGWLVVARDPDRICDTLSHVVPEFVHGQLLLQKCDIGHIRYRDDHWTGLYQLATCLPGETSLKTVILEGEIYAPGLVPKGKPQVQGAFGTQGWHAVIPELNLKLKTQESEKALSSLSFLTDPEESRQFLMQNIQAGSPKYHDMLIQASNPNVVRYKPGSRCTVLYQLEYPPETPSAHQWPDLVVAKIYRGEKGKNAFESMKALWDSPLGSSRTVHIAEPLAYNEHERVMIQGPIREEQTLKKFISALFQGETHKGLEDLDRVLRKTADGLAELHQSGVSLGQIWTFEDEMAAVRKKLDHLSVSVPDLAQAAEPLFDRLNQLAAVYPPDPRVPSHGSFRPAQVLLYKDQVGFIDFDTYCQSEPANDLALFLSSVMSLAMTNTDFDDVHNNAKTLGAAARIDRFALGMAVSENFLGEYEKYRPFSRQRVFLWEILDIFMLVLHGWIKVKESELSDILYLLQQYLQTKKVVGAL